MSGFVCLECGKTVKPKKNGETVCSGCGGTDVDVAPPKKAKA